ncbi:MAG: hypothetical protein A3F90_04445 [Deltaproteobacteria bacterium RIFCSPLOWO2_12_FULL_60_19]|nr:MAG: hypothetical protein A3F90_04445 [Deltaproteobacteria bacterium RIFCSPLOWO2_12_FULL_60_19]
MDKPSLQRVLFGVLLALSAAGTAPAVHAQEAPKPAGQQRSVSDKELRAFAGAYVEFHRIRQAYETRLSNVKDPKAREKIREEGDSKVKQALETRGLTPESYSQLFTAVNSNEQMRKKALKLIEAERKKS